METLRARIEALFVRIAARILSGRNVARAEVVSRADNEAMYYMAERLEQIAKRIESGYSDEALL